MQCRPWGKWFGLVALAVLGLGVVTSVAQGAATAENAALFYEALAPHGNWIQYGEYGPVWYPTKVSRDWRPYLDGRWRPTEMGWVFETAEPWGWATYHYGNWMPTLDFGWVWCPGRTWYPATVVWRTSRDYIGWAPLPPPFYTPPPAFGGGAYLSGGVPLSRLLTPYFWTFSPAAGFLLGFGRPFTPRYSFFHCRCLVPTVVYRLAFPQTAWLANFYSLGPGAGGYYAFGPSFSFVAQATSIKLDQIEALAKRQVGSEIHHLTPPAAVLQRLPHLRAMVPEAVLAGKPLQVAPAAERTAVDQGLLRPDLAPLPPGAPALKAEIPRAITVPFATRTGPEALKGVRGADLPAQAVNPKIAGPDLPTVPLPEPEKVRETPRPAPSAEQSPVASPPAREPGSRRGAHMIEVERGGSVGLPKTKAPTTREIAPRPPREQAVSPPPQTPPEGRPELPVPQHPRSRVEKQRGVPAGDRHPGQLRSQPTVVPRTPAAPRPLPLPPRAPAPRSAPSTPPVGLPGAGFGTVGR